MDVPCGWRRHCDQRHSCFAPLPDMSDSAREALVDYDFGGDEALVVQALPAVPTWAWIAASTSCFALSALGFFLLGHAHERPCLVDGVLITGYHGCLTRTEVIALLLMTWATPPGFLFLGALGTHLLLARGSGGELRMTSTGPIPTALVRADSNVAATDDAATALARAQLQRRGTLLRNFDAAAAANAAASVAAASKSALGDRKSSVSAWALTSSTSSGARVLAFAALTLLSAAAVAFCWVQLIQPQVVYGAGFGPNTGQGDPLSGAYGYLLQTAALFSFALFGAQTYRAHRGASGGGQDAAASGGAHAQRFSGNQRGRANSARLLNEDGAHDDGGAGADVLAEVQREWSPLTSSSARRANDSVGGVGSLSAPSMIERTPNTSNTYRAARALLRRPLHPNAAPRTACASVCGSFFAAFALLAVTFVMACTFSSLWPFNSSQYFPFQSPQSLLPDSWTQYFGAKFNFKLYTDVAVYFGTLLFIALLAVASHFFECIRKVLHYKVSIASVEGAFRTVGEWLVALCIAGLFVFWTLYWVHFLPGRERDDSQGDDSYFNLQIAARVTGHTGVLALALLAFPTARNSLWEAGFGCAFDRTVRFHRWLGQLAYALCTVHMVLWFVKWALQGLFWSNLFVIVGLRAGDGGDADTHWDNFSICTAEIAWLLMTAMCATAMWARRSNYELFLYTHHLAIGVFVTVIIHAWSAWFFLAPPLLFWALDKCLRAARTRAVTALALHCGCGDITRLVLPARALSTYTPAAHAGRSESGDDDSEAGTHHFAGQWVWLNIPAIAPLQWHPFSISSPPEAHALTLHIRATGASEHSFTRRLAALADACALNGSGQPPNLEVLIDGPYGRFPDFYSGGAHTLVLCAGGIGITPLIATFAQLFTRARAAAQLAAAGEYEASAADRNFGSVGGNEGGGASAERGMGATLRHVRLIWTVRSEHELVPFSEIFWAVRQNNPFDAFEVSVFVTRPSADSPAAASFAVDAGMLDTKAPPHTTTSAAAAAKAAQRVEPYPDLRALPVPFATGRAPLSRLLFEAGYALHATSAAGVQVVACGPHEMCAEAQAAADALGFAYHGEVFSY